MTLIETYLTHRRTAGYKPNTLRNETSTLYSAQKLSQFQFSTTNMSQISGTLVDSWFQQWAETNTQATLNGRLNHLTLFFRWCKAEGLMNHDPLHGRRTVKVVPQDRKRVVVGQFGYLLDQAGAHHPRDRVVCALGLFLLARTSEIRTLTWSDVDLDNQEIHVLIPKTSQRDIMPISEELDYELRKWATWLSTHGQPPSGEDYLCPGSRQSYQIDVRTPYQDLGIIARRSLLAIGFPIAGTREGMHTLRRSGARARFDVLVGQGYDGAIRQVMSLLHHTSVATTEKYLGINLDRVQRNQAIKGKPMYPMGHTTRIGVTNVNQNDSDVRSLRQRTG